VGSKLGNVYKRMDIYAAEQTKRGKKNHLVIVWKAVKLNYGRGTKKPMLESNQM